MVAVVNGTGLGLYTSPAATRDTVGSDGQAQNGQQIYVNATTGNLVVQDQDEALAGLGPTLSLVRTYNSQGLMDEGNGDNWLLSVQRRLIGLTGSINTAGSTITKEFGDGAQVVYTYNASLGVYVSALGEGANDTIAFDNSHQQWTWTAGASRTTELYNLAGQLQSSTDINGNTDSYGYNTSGQLTQISDMSGQTTTLDYNGPNLTAIHVVSGGQTQTLTHYSYDAQNRLITVTVDMSPTDNSIADGNTYVTSYTYDGTSTRIKQISQGDGTSVSFTYQYLDGDYRVATYTDGLGRTTTLNYSQPSSTGGGSVAPATGWSGPQILGGNSATPTNTNTQQLQFDALGNGTAVWYNGGQVLASHYDKASNTWTAPVTVGSGAVQGQLALSVGESGTALVAWASQTGGVYFSSYDAASNSWSTPQLLGGSGSGSIADLSVVTSKVNQDLAAVGWVQNNHAYVTTVNWYNGTTWDAPQVIDTGDGSSAQSPVSFSLAANLWGDMVSAVWVQSNGTSLGVYTNAETYTGTGTPSGYTWGTASSVNPADSNSDHSSSSTALAMASGSRPWPDRCHSPITSVGRERSAHR